jgi:hypothetical protein
MPATEGESDNWTSLRDMVSEDEGEGEGSDTDTIRAASPAHYGSGFGSDAQTPRKSTSIASVRSFFTARSNLTSERSLSIPRSAEGGRPVASALLSSSPPQMNGFSNGIEEMLDEGNDHRHGRQEDSGGMNTTDKLPSLLPSSLLDERQPLLGGLGNTSKPTSKSELPVPLYSLGLGTS